jgi:group I intron endonuclease
MLDGKSYIGSSINIEKRFKEHRKNLRNGYHVNVHLQEAWNEHGADSFVFLTLMLRAHEDLDKFEQQFIDQYGCVESGFNIRSVAKRARINHSEESKAKMSATKTGKVLTEEHKAKTSASMKGIVRTAEHNAKLGATRKGKPRSPETIRRMSEGQKGKKQSPETIAKRVATWAARKAAKKLLEELEKQEEKDNEQANV